MILTVAVAAIPPTMGCVNTIELRIRNQIISIISIGVCMYITTSCRADVAKFEGATGSRRDEAISTRRRLSFCFFQHIRTAG